VPVSEIAISRSNAEISCLTAFNVPPESPAVRITRRKALKTLFCSSALLALNLRPQTLSALGLADGELHFLTIGDYGSQGKEQEAVSRAMQKYVADHTLKADGLLLLGDNFYSKMEGGLESKRWKTGFEEMYPASSFPGPCWAILGNHDLYQDPDRVREDLTAAGYAVLGNGWREVTIRGARCIVVGHEGPWFKPAPDLAAAPAGLFRLCLSHTPDNFYWGAANRVGLMLCGHVHGGQIRVPVVGSIFVPSIFGRRFDRGVFEKYGTAMVVSRGVSGKEPLRFRCHPQVMRLTLRRRTPESSPLAPRTDL
jgi:predicted MPP superfamily phosphohydrolase